jgi:DNA-binding response OmpR family regulator
MADQFGFILQETIRAVNFVFACPLKQKQGGLVTERSFIILLAEDNPDHAELVLRMLNRYCTGIEVIHLLDGEVVLNFLNQKLQYPDKKLLDLRLPKVDGFELLRSIKNNPETKQIPVVVLTTSDAEEDIQKALKNGADNYLLKPIAIHQLAKVVDCLGKTNILWNRNKDNLQGEDAG